MIRKVYGVRDRKAMSVPGFVLLDNDEVARRMFELSAKEAEMIKAYPHDFELLCFGEFDTCGSFVEVYETPLVIASADEFFGNIK